MRRPIAHHPCRSKGLPKLGSIKTTTLGEAMLTTPVIELDTNKKCSTKDCKFVHNIECAPGTGKLSSTDGHRNRGFNNTGYDNLGWCKTDLSGQPPCRCSSLPGIRQPGGLAGKLKGGRVHSDCLVQMLLLLLCKLCNLAYRFEGRDPFLCRI